MHLTAKLAFWSNSPLDPVILRNCPQPLVTTPGLSHLGSECSRNSPESTPNLYSDQRAACYCNSAFYQYLLICSDRNIVYLVEINSIMLVPTSLKHNLHIILFPYWKITRDRVYFIILSLFVVLGLTIPSNILPLTLRSHSYRFLRFYDIEWSTD